MNNIENEIRAIISNISRIPTDADGKADLYSDLGVASVHALQILTELEDHFGIHIPDDQFVEASSIEKLAEAVQGLVN